MIGRQSSWWNQGFGWSVCFWMWGQRIEVGSLCSCTEIHECIVSKVISKNTELRGPGEKINITRFILMAADVQ
jgi:hypothetical protein